MYEFSCENIQDGVLEDLIGKGFLIPSSNWNKDTGEQTYALWCSY